MSDSDFSPQNPDRLRVPYWSLAAGAAVLLLALNPSSGPIIGLIAFFVLLAPLAPLVQPPVQLSPIIVISAPVVVTVVVTIFGVLNARTIEKRQARLNLGTLLATVLFGLVCSVITLSDAFLRN